MELIFKNQVNITVFITLLLVCIIAFRKLDKRDSLSRSFLITCFGVMLGLLAESTTEFLSGASSPFSIIMNNFFSVLLFIVAPIMSYNFFFFIYRIVFQGKILNKKIRLILMIPVISNIIISMLSPFYGLFFSIDNNGIYSRGPLWSLSAFSTYIFVIAGIILILKNQNRILKEDFWLILGIGIIPGLGGI
ncbi:MAG: hypothetical protein JXR62_02650, partial [Bacilli bacterium]|nr:hypothetical protein [Bacilli bacterium]